MSNLPNDPAGVGGDELLGIENKNAGAGFGSGARIDRPSPRPAEPNTVRSTGSRRILVVEDNVDSAQALATLLELYGHEVRTAHEGMGAIDVAKAFRPNVVLIDIALPGIDGYEVARRLRQLRGSEKLVLLAMTGFGQERDRAMSREAGFDDHMLKPVSPDVLLKAIANS